MSTLKAFSALLSYPTGELVNALPEITRQFEQDARLTSCDRTALASLADELSSSDLLDVQERYVDLFDRGRATALHLFEHVHGESRDRGQAMVDLGRIYAEAGFALSTHELPDYLPALLEFLAHRSDAEAHEMLSDCAHVLRAIGEALVVRESHYAAVFAALLALIGAQGLRPDAAREARPEKSLDEEWAETPAFDGLGCSAHMPPKKSIIRFVKRAA